VNKLFRENVVSFLVRTTYVKGIVTKVARWPHGCRRKYSEVAVPMLVSSNLTEGGGFFQGRNLRRAMDVCLCLLGADGRVVEGRINTLSATTARSARVRVPSGKGAHGCISVVYVCEYEVE
jgi:hypothetical protein